MMSCQDLPDSEFVEQLAEFWDTHDLTDFEDESEEVTGPTFGATGKGGPSVAPGARVHSGSLYEEHPVGRPEEVLKRILSGVADANIRFDDLRRLLQRLGFEERMRGSHHIFRRSGIHEKVNVQRDGNHAKPYQIRQVRAVILRNKLAGELKC